MASIIRTSGIVQDVGLELSLEKLQELVGGYCESISIPGSDTGVLIVNEDGIGKGMLINESASLIVRRPIVGDAVVCTRTLDGKLL